MQVEQPAAPSGAEGAPAPANVEQPQPPAGTPPGSPPAESGANDADDDLNDWSDPRSAKARFTKLSQIAREAEQAAREAEQRALRLEGRLDQHTRQNGANDRPTPPAQTDPNPEPNVRDKERYPLGRDDPQYIEDRALWRLRNEQAAETRQRQERESAQQEFTARRSRYFDAVGKAKANTDTPNAAAQLGAMPTLFTDEIVLSEHSALIAEHLATNKAEYDKLLSDHVRFDKDGNAYWRTPRSQADFARKIGSLENALPGTFAARKQTKAPPPPGSALSGAGASGGKSLDAMSVEELDAHIKKLRAGRDD